MQKQQGVGVVRDIEGALQVGNRSLEVAPTEECDATLLDVVRIIRRQIDRRRQAADRVVEVMLTQMDDAKFSVRIRKIW